MNTRHSVRPAAVAGYFYPIDKVELRTWIEKTVQQFNNAKPAAKAMIVPHAGYQYSGAVAAKAFARLNNPKKAIERVVLVGPGHRVGFDGIAAPSDDAFATPLGEVAVDRAAIDALIKEGLVQQFDGAHCLEHSLEVQLPFLQTVLSENFSIVPLLVGWCSPDKVAKVIEKLWGGDETLILASSDLSHFLAYDEAQILDAETREAIENGREEVLDADHACGFLPVSGLMKVAREKDLSAHCLDMLNSGDTAGSKERVVGYGAWVFE